MAHTHPLPRLLGSTVALKAAMAVSGLLLVGFLVGHMVGNLQVFGLFGGREAMNAYGAFLHSKPMLLWGARIGLLVMIAIHIGSAMALIQRNQAARPIGYQMKKPIASTYASRTMRWSGPIITAYILYHLAHFTVAGVGIQGFPLKDAAQRVDVYQHVVNAFQSPLVSLIYVVAMGLLSMHLWHGLWSLFQSLGLSNARWNALKRPMATGLTVFIIAGFMAVPLGVLFGIVK
jgi:succinate dehydrogenase / fumarate reductase cytochrome b subunit